MIPEKGRHRIPLRRPLYLWALRWEDEKAAYEVTEHQHAQPVPLPPPSSNTNDSALRCIERLGCFDCIESASDGSVYLPLKVDDGVELPREDREC